MNKIIIYGVGEYGKRLYSFLKQLGCTIDYFCQTKCDEEACYDGVKIIDLEQLGQISGKLKILISVGDSNISGHIKSQLLNRNYWDIYECGGFVHQNLLDIMEKTNCQCNVCGKNVNEFEKSEFSPSKIYNKYHIIGGGMRENALCPFCGSIDRIRWQYWVMVKHTGIFIDRCAVLHFAPEHEISVRLQENVLCDYYMGDIVHGKAMNIVDATNIQFRDNFFDYIIMNHVLEHIEDERKAIDELKRVLKPEGKLILSFPICTDKDTYEDICVKTPKQRLDEYGQEDHVRLYGKDYKTRLESYGLKITIFSPYKECNIEEIARYGFIYDDVIMMCEKRL